MTHKRDYYTISLPTDLENENDQWEERMCEHAIDEAREQARLYVIPCTWSAKLLHKGDWESKFRVKRERR